MAPTKWSAVASRLIVFGLFGSVAFLGGCTRQEGSTVEGNAGLEGGSEYDYLQEYAAGNYEHVIPYIRERLKQDPNDGREWFRLGYGLHETGVFDEAIEAYKKAAELDPGQRQFAYYNWACALAMSGNKDAAINRLKEAVDQGFNRKKTIVNDPDLDSLKNDPRFTQLVKTISPPQGSREFISESTEFDFFVGRWGLHNDDNRKVLNVEVASEHNGYLIRERWQGSAAAPGSSMSYFDPAVNQWKQVRFSNEGVISHYTGTWVNGAMRFEGRILRGNQRVLRRRVYTPRQDGRAVDVVIEDSENDGKDWTTLFTGRYVPRKPRLAG